MTLSPIIVALDFSSATEALAMAERLDPKEVRVKVGKELFVRVGPEILRQLGAMGFQIFLDLKFHDIPNTVAGAVRAACEHGVWMVNVHASGGPAMLDAARAAVDEVGQGTLLTGVTVLTSMDTAALAEVGCPATTDEQVLLLATLAQRHGLDGVVCSGRELALLAGSFPSTFLRVTPGIRPADAGKDDQQRTMTPSEALACGASYLVVGRPITRASNPQDACADLLRTIQRKDPA